MTYAADAFFDFDKAVLKGEGKAKLDDLVGKVKGINLEVIIAVGHTDSVGTEDSNQVLSIRRAIAASDYLRKQGVLHDTRVEIRMGQHDDPVSDAATFAESGLQAMVLLDHLGRYFARAEAGNLEGLTHARQAGIGCGFHFFSGNGQFDCALQWRHFLHGFGGAHEFVPNE